jgi:hypothetical protein
VVNEAGEGFPPAMSPADAAEFKRRRRSRNVVLLVVLVGIAALFYAISMVKFKVS